MLFCVLSHVYRKEVESTELLLNNTFSVLSDAGLPEGWYTDAYVRSPGYTDYEILENAGPTGQNAIHIMNHELNDARLAQIVAVEPNSLYCLSGWIKAQTVGGHGANLSVEGVYSFPNCVYDTEGEWQRITLYGRTKSDQHSITVFARLGGYSGESLGEAWFADLSLQKVSEVPPEEAVQDFFPPSYQNAANHQWSFDLRHVLLILFVLLYGMMLYRCVRTQSIQGLLVLIAATAVLGIFFATRVDPDPNEVVSQLSLPVPYVKYVMFALNLVTILTTLCLAYYLSRRNMPIKRLGRHPARVIDRQFHQIDKKDWVLLLLITILYAGLAYTNLGSTTSPQTSFVFSDVDEYVIYDLGEVKEDFRMLYMGGIHYGTSDFTVQVSDDGELWSDPYSCEQNEGTLFKWAYVNSYQPSDTRSLSGRYVRLTAEHRGLTLFETLFRDAEEQPLPVTVTDSLGRDATALIDEPDTITGEPSWYNSMYFDEIYHARTGYEHLQGIVPYEISHPPLGKVLMSWCIALFGMTPFGWRFAGATCGVLMLPGMYLLGKLLFSKRRYAVLPCLLLAFDTMHFTQTRIATIDSFVVLFIVWSVYFMLRWFYTDFFRQKLWVTMVPLALSGFFMGLAIASKWTGCFAGIGLAAIFFYGIWRRWRVAREAHLVPEKERGEIALAAASNGYRRLLLTVASCLIFFVIIPVIIYWCSYIPYFAPSGGVTIERIVDAAKYMLNYHSKYGLGMDHRFYSPWYQWPFSETPMYYASHKYTPDGYTYSIFALGNYAVWWSGFLALLIVTYAYCVHQLLPVLTGSQRQMICPLSPEGERDERPALLLICFAAQFLPWALVPRGTYIYHYFPSVPFIILCATYVLERLNDWIVSRSSKKADKRFLWLVVMYLIVAAAMFVAFFPVASGITVRREWMEAINWFHNLYY